MGASIVGKSTRWILAVTVGLLASIGVGASAAHYLQEPYNPGFLHFPILVALHVVLGGVYLALAPFQFVRRIRSRHLDYHRWAGRLLVSVGLAVGATALFMGLVIPKGGAAQGVDDPGVRRRTRHRHCAPDLLPRAPDHRGRPDRRAVRDALGRVVGGGVRPARLCGGAVDPRHSQERRAYS